MSVMTPSQVFELLGELDDERVASLLATGASAEELGEAIAEVTAELEEGELAPPPSSPRVAALRGIVGEILGEAREDIREEHP